jgi:hypothetical protein
MWMKLIALICISVVVGIGLATIYGKFQWQLDTDKLRAKLTSGQQIIHPKIYNQKELEGLPVPVQRFFQTVLKDDQALVATVKLSQQGQFNMSETEAKWSPFTATQLVITQRPGFDWDARIQMAPGLNAFVHDAYVLGEGVLHASLLGLFTVADVHGTPEAAQGELLRFFAETAWYPTALLPSQGVRWEAIDDTSARATLTDDSASSSTDSASSSTDSTSSSTDSASSSTDSTSSSSATTVSLVFQFNAEGAIATIRAEARYRDKLTAMPWCGRFGEYSLRNGMLIPLQGEVGWEYPEGTRLYFKGTITEINYEFAL